MRYGNGWSDKWPTEPGYYWAYGNYKIATTIPPRIVSVHVIRATNNALDYIVDGDKIYPNSFRAAWCGATLPPLPDLLET